MLQVVQAIGSLNCQTFADGSLIKDIKRSLRGFESVRVHHVRRTINYAAHRMANLALFSNFSCFLFEEIFSKMPSSKIISHLKLMNKINYHFPLKKIKN